MAAKTPAASEVAAAASRAGAAARPAEVKEARFFGWCPLGDKCKKRYQMIACETNKGEAQQKVGWHLHKSEYHQMEWQAAMALAKGWIREGVEGEWPDHPGFSNAAGSDRSPPPRSVQPTPSSSASPPGSRLRLASRRTSARSSPERGVRRQRDRSREPAGRARDIRSPASPPRRRQRPPPSGERLARKAAPPAATAAAPTVAGAALAMTAPPAATLAAPPIAGTPQELQMVFFVCICSLPPFARPPARRGRQPTCLAHPFPR